MEPDGTARNRTVRDGTSGDKRLKSTGDGVRRAKNTSIVALASVKTRPAALRRRCFSDVHGVAETTSDRRRRLGSALCLTRQRASRWASTRTALSPWCRGVRVRRLSRQHNRRRAVLPRTCRGPHQGEYGPHFLETNFWNSTSAGSFPAPARCREKKPTGAPMTSTRHSANEGWPQPMPMPKQTR
jgi:hypothetical protein